MSCLHWQGYFQKTKDLSEGVGGGGGVPFGSIEERRLSISRSSSPSVKWRCLFSNLVSVFWPWVPPLEASLAWSSSPLRSGSTWVSCLIRPQICSSSVCFILSFKIAAGAAERPWVGHILTELSLCLLDLVQVYELLLENLLEVLLWWLLERKQQQVECTDGWNPTWLCSLVNGTDALGCLTLHCPWSYGVHNNHNTQSCGSSWIYSTGVALWGVAFWTAVPISPVGGAVGSLPVGRALTRWAKCNYSARHVMRL